MEFAPALHRGDTLMLSTELSYREARALQASTRRAAIVAERKRKEDAATIAELRKQLAAAAKEVRVCVYA